MLKHVHISSCVLAHAVFHVGVIDSLLNSSCARHNGHVALETGSHCTIGVVDTCFLYVVPSALPCMHVAGKQLNPLELHRCISTSF